MIEVALILTLLAFESPRGEIYHDATWLDVYKLVGYNNLKTKGQT